MTKKIFLQSFALATVLVSSTCAFSEEGKKDETEKPLATFNMMARARYSLWQSEKATDTKPNGAVVSGNARMGGTIAYGNVNAEILADIGGMSDAADTHSENKVRLRRANVGMDVLHSETMAIGFKIGRIQPTSGTDWGPDYVTDFVEPINGLGFDDGIQFDVAAKLGGMGKLSAQFFVVESADISDRFSSFQASTRTANTEGSVFSKAQRKKSGFGGSLDAVVNAGPGAIDFTVATYSRKEDSVTTVAIPGGAPASTSYIPNVMYTEVSLGYEMGTMMKGGVWWDGYSIKKPTSATDNNEYASYKFGIGMEGTSEMFGMTGLIAKNDHLTYSAAYTMDAIQKNNAYTVGVAGSKPTINTVALGAGYEKGPMSFNLNYGFDSTNAKENNFFVDKDDKASTSQHRIYLVGEVAL